MSPFLSLGNRAVCTGFCVAQVFVSVEENPLVHTKRCPLLLLLICNRTCREIGSGNRKPVFLRIQALRAAALHGRHRKGAENIALGQPGFENSQFPLSTHAMEQLLAQELEAKNQSMPITAIPCQQPFR